MLIMPAVAHAIVNPQLHEAIVANKKEDQTSFEFPVTVTLENVVHRDKIFTLRHQLWVLKTLQLRLCKLRNFKLEYSGRVHETSCESSFVV